MAEILRLAQYLIYLAEGDPTKGSLVTESPLSVATVLRGVARGRLGISGGGTTSARPWTWSVLSTR